MDKELLAALETIIDAVEVNDSDTLSRYFPDDKIIWVASGSWSGSRAVTLGDLRKIAKLANAMLAARKKES